MGCDKISWNCVVFFSHGTAYKKNYLDFLKKKSWFAFAGLDKPHYLVDIQNENFHVVALHWEISLKKIFVVVGWMKEHQRQHMLNFSKFDPK